MKMLILVIFSLFLFGLSASAGVNLKNGNFYISYSDIFVPGPGEDLEVTRTYNSKSTEKGWFGFGWGNKYETKLMFGADGSVTVREHGGGARTRFTPKKSLDGMTAAKKIVDAMRKKNKITEKVANGLIDKLSKDQQLRLAYAKRYGVKSKIATGTVLYSNRRGIQELHKTNEGYKRVMSSGTVTDYFNEDGTLLKVVHSNGFALDFSWKNGVLKSIKDNKAKQLFFDWYPDGRLKATWSAGDKKAEYKYKGDDLIFSKDVAGNSYKYSYDSNHNLIKIEYNDKTSLEIGYEPKTQFVSQIKNRKGDVTKYSYGSDPKNADHHYWTNVEKKNLLGKVVKDKYEYEIRTRPDGSTYTHKIATMINGLNTETLYTECCGLPKKITRGKKVTDFEYNDKGLLLKKTSTTGEFVQLEYNNKFDKISKVTDKKGTTDFSYDSKGNLTKAVNSHGKAVLLLYDRKGQISKMVDNDLKTKKKRTLAFKYNTLGKPVEINMDSVGKINIAYDNYGEIKKVDSKAGHKMAVQVTQAFQNLLAIVKPAGVSLSL